MRKMETEQPSVKDLRVDSKGIIKFTLIPVHSDAPCTSDQKTFRTNKNGNGLWRTNRENRFGTPLVDKQVRGTCDFMLDPDNLNKSRQRIYSEFSIP